MARKRKFTPLLDLLHRRLAEDVVSESEKAGNPVTLDRAEAKVVEVAGDHPILDLLKSLDWSALVSLILKLLLAAKATPDADPATGE